MNHGPEGGTVKCYHVNPDAIDYLFDVVIVSLKCFSIIELLYKKYNTDLFSLKITDPEYAFSYKFSGCRGK